MIDNRKKMGFGPVFDENSKILVLGSFPSVKSREVDFYYGNKQNRFWRFLASYFHTELPSTKEEKKALLLKKGVALWDIVVACEIDGSSDSSIRNVELADLNKVLNYANIEKIFLNGKLAYRLFCERYGDIQIPYEYLPSTSPANPRYDEKVWRLAFNEIFGLA